MLNTITRTKDVNPVEKARRTVGCMQSSLERVPQPCRRFKVRVLHMLIDRAEKEGLPANPLLHESLDFGVKDGILCQLCQQHRCRINHIVPIDLQEIRHDDNLA